jgi:hypothetical protein
MSQDDHQARPELLSREFDATDLRRSDNIAGYADDKQIAQPLIEDDLHGHSRIGTAQNGRERFLARGQFDATGSTWQCVSAANVCDKTAISVSQPSERFRTRYRRRVTFFGGHQAHRRASLRRSRTTFSFEQYFRPEAWGPCRERNILMELPAILLESANENSTTRLSDMQFAPAKEK